MEKNFEQTMEWNAQGKTTFVKAKEAFAIDRLMLDFVEHSGKPECKMKNSVQIYIPMIKSGSDSQSQYGGTGETGQTALGLAKLIVSNQLAKRAEVNRKKAASEGKDYAEDIWGCIGGTTANRSKDGKAVYRRVSIAPGKAEGSYILRAETCEGEESSSGGVMPKKNAPRTRITVRVDGLYMDALGEFILTEWSAYRTAQMLGSASAPAEPEAASEFKAPEPAPAAVEVSAVYMIYDLQYYGPIASATDPQEAIAKLRTALVKLRDEHSLVSDPDQAKQLKEEILSVSENRILQEVNLFEKGTDSRDVKDRLFVMVDVR